MWYDVFVVGVLIVCTVRGAMRGVIWQLAGIAGLVLCLVFAESIAAAAGPYVGLAEPLNHWVTMFGAYLFFSFLSFGVARMINAWMEKAQMTEFNRHLGAVFGLLKGMAICLVLTFFIVTLSPNARAMLQHSRSGYAAAVIMDRLHPVMPEKLHDSLEKYIHQLDSPEFPLEHTHDHLHADGDALDPNDVPLGPVPLEEPPPGISDPWEWSGTASAPINPLDEILKRIPGLGQEQTRGIVERAYQNTPPSLKAELLGQLRAAAPSMISNVATNWLNQAIPLAPSQTPPANDQSSLTRDIAARLSPIPAEQARYDREIEESLRELPEELALGVLRDWRADLTGEGTDPDPQTTADTSVDQRIIRQLTLQRVSVYQLSDALQTRLRAAVQR